jgi:hypothetical protein
MAIKYTKNKPKFFWYENKPSGNPAMNMYGEKQKFGGQMSLYNPIQNIEIKIVVARIWSLNFYCGK